MRECVFGGGMERGRREERERGPLRQRGNFSNDMEVGNNTMCTDTYLYWIITYELRNGYSLVLEI